MNQDQLATDAIKEIRTIGRLSMAAIAGQTREGISRMVRRPVDPIVGVFDDVLQDLHAIAREVDDAIVQIEQAKREWQRRNYAAVVVRDGDGPDGQPAESV